MTAFKAAFSSATCDIPVLLHVVEFRSIQGKIVFVAEKGPD